MLAVMPMNIFCAIAVLVLFVVGEVVMYLIRKK